MTSRKRMDVTQEHWELLEEVARLQGVQAKVVLRDLLFEVRLAHERGNVMTRVAGHWGIAVSNLGQRTAAAELRDSSIDTSLLHVSHRTSSGYEGVYPHPGGRGFIARGRAPGSSPKDHASGTHLGLFPTAEAAAWARYQHYQKHGMPYGIDTERIVTKIKKACAKAAASSLYESMNRDWLKINTLCQLAEKGEDISAVYPGFKLLDEMTIWMLSDNNVPCPDLFTPGAFDSVAVFKPPVYVR